MSTEVLLVDDNLEFLNSLSNRLKDQGYNITAAKNGELALASCEERVYDIVIADLRLPGAVNGWDIIAATKEKCPRSHSFAITAYPSPDHKNKALSLGTFAYLEKPISLDLIVDLVHTCLQKQKLELELETLRGEKEYFSECSTTWRLLHDAFNSLPFPAFIMTSAKHLILINNKAQEFFDSLTLATSQNEVITVPSQLDSVLETALSQMDLEKSYNQKIKIGTENFSLRCWKINTAVDELALSVLLEPVEIMEESLLNSEVGRVWLPILLRMIR